MTWYEQIGDKFYQARHAKRQTIEFVAEQTGLTPKTISNIENGNSPGVKGETLFKLSEFYRLKIYVGKDLIKACNLDEIDT